MEKVTHVQNIRTRAKFTAYGEFSEDPEDFLKRNGYNLAGPELHLGYRVEGNGTIHFIILAGNAGIYGKPISITFPILPKV